MVCLKLEGEEFSNIIRKVLKDNDITFVDCIKIFCNTVTILMNELQQEKKISAEDLIDYFEDKYNDSGISIPLMSIGIIMKIQNAILENENKKLKDKQN